MRRILVISLTAALVLAACGTNAPTQRVAPTSIPAPTQVPATDGPVPTLAPTTPYTPAPTADLGGYLLTQAYAAFTPQASATPLTTEVPPTAVPATHTSGSGGPLPTATPVTPTAVPLLFVKEPIQIPNAFNTAECQIRDFGDCTVTMQSGITVFLTYTFDVASTQFTYGDAAVVTTKDGKQYAWSQSGNSLVKPPDFTKNESWVLSAGQQAEFSAGLENLQPGHYTARLYICPNTPQQCSAGQGWQTVGGDAVNFIITQ